MPNVGISNGGK